VQNNGSVTVSLEDSITSRPAILMHLTAIAEQFNKLKQEHADDILNAFDEQCNSIISKVKFCTLFVHF
jgi:hypothetical protein